jgi:hypothetical protein
MCAFFWVSVLLFDASGSFVPERTNGTGLLDSESHHLYVVGTRSNDRGDHIVSVLANHMTAFPKIAKGFRPCYR